MKKLIAFNLLIMALTIGVQQIFAQNNSGKNSQNNEVVYSKNPEANSLFLKGRDFYRKSDPRILGGNLENAKEAIKLYQQAVALDPKFALAYVEMARAWLQLSYSDKGGLTNKEILPHSKSALLKAISIDKNLAEAHITLAGLYYGIEYYWEKAEQEYKIAIQLAPKNPSGYIGYASFLASMGRFEEAVSTAGKAEEIAETLNTDITPARIYYSMKQYDKAAEFCRKSLQKGENVLGHFYLGFVLTAQKKFEEGISEFRKAADFSKNGGALAGLAYGYAMSGKKEEALQIINELKITDGGTRLVPYRIAAVYVALNEPDEAINWLKKDYAVKGNWMNQLKVDPVMDPLRNFSEFKKIMRVMKLEDS